MSAPDAKLPHAEVIGCPIVHSRSPVIHGFWLDRLGIAARYQACHVMPAELASYLGVRRNDPSWRGCNVTIPHKQSAALLVHALDARAAAVGATNTILRQPDGTLLGTNTDVDGIGEALDRAGWTGGPAVVLGSGGAARAAFAYLASAADKVCILARNEVKARGAAMECGIDAAVLRFAPDSGGLAGATLLINATQLGMSGEPAMPEFILDEIRAMTPDAVVLDMVYAPLRTALLASAERNGRLAVDGLSMLIGQAATAFTRFFGQPPPREHDGELRAMLMR